MNDLTQWILMTSIRHLNYIQQWVYLSRERDADAICEPAIITLMMNHNLGTADCWAPVIMMNLSCHILELKPADWLVPWSGASFMYAQAEYFSDYKWPWITNDHKNTGFHWIKQYFMHCNQIQQISQGFFMVAHQWWAGDSSWVLDER